MKVLVLGVGAIGGYFGARLVAAGRDVTFLVKKERARVLAQDGLHVESTFGNIDIGFPSTVTEGELSSPFDLLIVSCKAQDLDAAIRPIDSAVGQGTLILPLLNGMKHLDVLTNRFGAEHVIGGTCFISTVRDNRGHIRHLNNTHQLSFGEIDGTHTARIKRVFSALANAGFDAVESNSILSDMWEKWVFIATVAGITCLMRASIGDIISAGAEKLISQLLEECISVAAAEGFAPRAAARAQIQSTLSARSSQLTASMLRDLEGGYPLETEQVIGDLIQRGKRFGFATPLLEIVYAHLRSYEIRRERTCEQQASSDSAVQALESP